MEAQKLWFLVPMNGINLSNFFFALKNIEKHECIEKQKSLGFK